MFDLINEILQALSHNKLRTALTGLAVAWGIFMLIVLLGVGHGVTHSFEEHALTPGSQKINVWGGTTTRPYHGYREGREIALKSSDIQRIEKENNAHVAEVNTAIYGSSTNITHGTKSISTNYEGVYPSEIVMRNEMKMAFGRFINDKDMANCAKVIVLSTDNASELGLTPDDSAIGQRISMSGLSFQIIGLYKSRWGRAIYIPFTTAKLLAGNVDELGSLNVMLKNVQTEEDGNAVEQQLRQTLAAAHDFDPDDSGAVWIWNQFSSGMRGLKANRILNIGIWILGLLTLLSGIVGISNIMFVSVRERTHEIGIRRAIGAKPRSILVQVIAESVAITTLFGYIGILLGTVTNGILDHLYGNTDFMSHPQVNIGIALQVTAVLIMAGAMAGLFPALKALKVKPVEALRDE